eukprot:463416_1
MTVGNLAVDDVVCDEDDIFIWKSSVTANTVRRLADVKSATLSDSATTSAVDCEDCDGNNDNFDVDIGVALRCGECDDLVELAKAWFAVQEDGSFADDFKETWIGSSVTQDVLCQKGFGDVDVNAITATLYDEDGAELY